MLNYTAERQSHWPYIIRQWLVSSIVLFLPAVYDMLFPNDYINEIYYWIAAALSLARFIDLASRQRTYRIAIDEDAKTIAQYYRSSFEGKGEKSVLLEKVQLYVKKPPSPSTTEETPKNLVLYKGKREVLTLSKGKDGFAPRTLREIWRALEKLGVPVTG
jgi:hypothetical protein